MSPPAQETVRCWADASPTASICPALRPVLNIGDVFAKEISPGGGALQTDIFDFAAQADRAHFLVVASDTNPNESICETCEWIDGRPTGRARRQQPPDLRPEHRRVGQRRVRKGRQSTADVLLPQRHLGLFDMGYRLDVDRAHPECLDITRAPADRKEPTLHGSGVIRILTPPEFHSGATYHLTTTTNGKPPNAPSKQTTADYPSRSTSATPPTGLN